MINYILIILSITGSVSSWIVAKWALKKDGEAKVMGFWAGVSGTIMAAIVLLYFDHPFYKLEIFRSGVIVGFSYAIGYLWIIMYCLKIGPAGPTTTVNNSAMIFGVLYSIVFVNQAVPGFMISAGIIGSIVSLVIIGISGSNGSSKIPINPKWVKLVMVGGILSGVSFVNQAYIGINFPGVDNILIFVFWANLFASIVLAGLIVYSKFRFYKKQEFIGGNIVGILSSLCVLINLYVMKFFQPEVVMPLTIVTPMIVMFFIGRFYYKEKFNKYIWLGSILAIISITLLTIGR
jgi:drug/metabolite transporter (DMT)-like permease